MLITIAIDLAMCAWLLAIALDLLPPAFVTCLEKSPDVSCACRHITKNRIVAYSSYSAAFLQRRSTLFAWLAIRVGTQSRRTVLVLRKTVVLAFGEINLWGLAWLDLGRCD